jgi:hypothetical protein
VANLEALQNYIVSIATDSDNSVIYCIFKYISRPETFREVLTYNGGQKRCELKNKQIKPSPTQHDAVINLPLLKGSLFGCNILCDHKS